MNAVLRFLWAHWLRLAILAGSAWTAFGLTYWSALDWRAIVALLILAVWVLATFALPRRRTRKENSNT